MTATCTITTVTDPVTVLNETAVVATGTCTALNTVTVTIEDSAGATVGPTSATVTGTGWSLAATNISALSDGALVYKATSSDGSAQAFDAAPATKMTAAPSYITQAQFREYIKDNSTNDTQPIQNAILTASRTVEDMCGRKHFFQVTEARYFWPDNQGQCCIDDLATTTSLAVAVDSAGDGTYAQAWTLNTDFFPEPVNRDIGWPYTELAATFNNFYFPQRYGATYRHPTIRVTGTWGWPSVPYPVHQAVFVAAAQLYKLADLPFGATMGEFGVMRVKENPIIQQMLGPYSKTAGVVVA